GAAVTLLCQQTVSAEEPAAQVQAEKPAAPAPAREVKKAEASLVTVAGVVLGPDGQPCAGAKLFLAGRVEATDKGRRQLGTADDRGRFQLTLAPDEREKDNLLVASGAGVGPDWVGTRGLKMGEEITLRLVRDDVPITGRLLDLEGRPLANISVQVH